MAGSEKSDGAFRTIREVADWLVVPTHVLRFWESKFEQIAPVKGAGGRRYYRPDDMRLLGGIKVMLHDQGLTVRGVSQKIDDEGVDAVMDLSPGLDAVDAPPQRTRRVIRTDDEVPSEKVVAFNRKPEPTPAPPPSQPDTLDHEAEPPQPVDVDAPPQPVDDGPTAPETAPQPEPDTDLDTIAPGSDPTPPAENERGPERSPPPDPDSPDAVQHETAEAVARTQETPSAQPHLSRLETRQLRRTIRKLRGLIEEVEAEMSEGGPT